VYCTSEVVMLSIHDSSEQKNKSGEAFKKTEVGC
jgi:hypothetical protein